MFTGTVGGNDVYYRIIKSWRTGLMTVVTMQWFDEPDYDQSAFVRNSYGETYGFEDEQEAISKMCGWYKEEQIDPEYRNHASIDLVR